MILFSSRFSDLRTCDAKIDAGNSGRMDRTEVMAIEGPTTPLGPNSPNMSPRARRGPITRLLPRPRQNTASTPTSAVTRVAAASTGTLTTLGAAKLPPKDVRARMCVSLPTRRLSLNPESATPSPGTRLHRRARRFPKARFDVRDPPSRSPRDLPSDALNQFFDRFAPSRTTLADFYSSFGEGACSDRDDERDRERESHEILDADYSSESATCRIPSPEEPGQRPASSSSDGTSQDEATKHNFKGDIVTTSSVGGRDMNDRADCENSQDALNQLRADMSMLCRLVQSELRECRHVQQLRYSHLQETVNETVRLAESLEDRLDSLRVPQHRGELRPSATLALTIMDGIASLLLFVISVFIARPVAFARRTVSKIRGVPESTVERPLSENFQRLSRSWRLSNKDLNEPFLDNATKRLSFSAAKLLD